VQIKWSIQNHRCTGYLFAGFFIQKINGVSIEGKSMAECLGLMGGPAGKQVRLELLDPKLNETKVVELTKGKFLTSS